MKANEYAMTDYLQLIDTHTQAPRYDLTPLFANAEGFRALVDDLLGQIGDTAFDLVAGIDALGFVLGTALAVRTQRGFLTVRKGGKLHEGTAPLWQHYKVFEIGQPEE